LRPLLPKHYRIRVKTGRGGEDELVFTSERKRLVVGGRSFGAFVEHIVPLLDGQHTLDEIRARVGGVFDPLELEDSLSLLVQHRIVEDADQVVFPDDVQERIEPQLNYLREVSPVPGVVVERLANAQVTVVGLGAVGAVAATSLAAANVGRVRCVDDSAISPADPFLAQIFGLSDVGRLRADVTRERINAVNPSTEVEVLADGLETDDDAATAVAGADFVLGCLDPGLVSRTFRLNRVCLTQGVPWAAGTVTAFEGIVGPTVIPYETACYLCYQMRAVACADDPADALAELTQTDASRTDESRHREGLSFGAGIVGHLLGLEAFKALIGLRPPTAGRILTVDFTNSGMKQHVVLRKPWCPACFRAPGEA
jgi:adenylyltransferase/sulfurtransferase